MTARERLIKRLGPYWQMEAAAALLIPGTMLLLSEGRLGPASWFAMVPMVIMLIIGAAYWRGKYRQLIERGYDIKPLLRKIARWKAAVLALSIFAITTAILIWLFPHYSVGFADRVCATIAASLALLEYVNYFHRQLQHFDNMTDFKRLLAGKGFRRSQMAVDLAAFLRRTDQ